MVYWVASSYMNVCIVKKSHSGHTCTMRMPSSCRICSATSSPF